MAIILTELINVDIDSKYSRIHEPFRIYLETLKREIEVQTGFVHDYESIPLLKGSSKHGGVVHDYLSRYDSIPVVTKAIAAACYFEVAEMCVVKDENEGWFSKLDRWWRASWKAMVVRIAWGYFHKHSVNATYEELKNG